MAEWQPIDSAPKTRKVDLWAKCWLADGDRFIAERYPDCRWDSGDSMCNRGPSWSGLPKGWHPTHWMERPDAPPDRTTLYQPNQTGAVAGGRLMDPRLQAQFDAIRETAERAGQVYARALLDMAPLMSRALQQFGRQWRALHGKRTG